NGPRSAWADGAGHRISNRRSTRQIDRLIDVAIAAREAARRARAGGRKADVREGRRKDVADNRTVGSAGTGVGNDDRVSQRAARSGSGYAVGFGDLQVDVVFRD